MNDARMVNVIAHGMAERATPLEERLLGTRDPSEVLACVGAHCAETLGAPPVDVLFYAASVGAVYGFVLADGRKVVVKLHAARVGESYLSQLADLMRHATARGLPAPLPLAPVGRLRSSLVTIERVLDEGEAPDAHDPAMRDAIARALGRFVVACRDFAGARALTSWFEPPPDQIWPPPHDIRFDFAGTSAGARWIDELGSRARRAMQPGSARVVGHADWRREHLRFDAQRLSAIYDWDSVAFVPETTLVASAMRVFPADWSRECTYRQYPTLDEMRAFQASYELDRGTPFAVEERRQLNAALVYGAAYTARCELSDAMTDFGARPPAPAMGPEGVMTTFLRVHGEALLTDR